MIPTPTVQTNAKIPAISWLQIIAGTGNLELKIEMISDIKNFASFFFLTQNIKPLFAMQVFPKFFLNN